MNARNNMFIMCVAAAVGGSLAAAVMRATAAPRVSTAVPPIAVTAINGMSALERAGTASDEAVRHAVADAVAALTDPSGAPDESMVPGAADMRTLRIFLNVPGVSGRYIMFGVKTRRGRVCGGLVGGGLGCLDGFRPGVPLTYTLVRAAGKPLLLYGFAQNGVRNVGVEVAGSVEAASMGGNAFLWQASDRTITADAVTGLRVSLANDRDIVHVPLTFIGN